MGGAARKQAAFSERVAHSESSPGKLLKGDTGRLRFQLT